jgi:hypothetical protein
MILGGTLRHRRIAVPIKLSRNSTRAPTTGESIP